MATGSNRTIKLATSEMAENLKNQWEKFSGFLSRRKITKIMLEEGYYERYMSRNIDGHN